MGSDFRRRFVMARRMLDKGAIAFCIFLKGEIAHIGWIALSEEAHKAVDNLPTKWIFEPWRPAPVVLRRFLNTGARVLWHIAISKGSNFLGKRG